MDCPSTERTKELTMSYILLALAIGLQLVMLVVLSKTKLGFSPSTLFALCFGMLALAAFDSISANHVAPPSSDAWAYIMMAGIDFVAAVLWFWRLVANDPRTRR